MRELRGEAADWSLNTFLLALVADALHAANWQRGGKKNAPRPKPLPRPRTPAEVSAAEALAARRLHRLRQLAAASTEPGLT